MPDSRSHQGSGQLPGPRLAAVIFYREPLSPSRSAELASLAGMVSLAEQGRQIAAHYWDPLRREYRGSPSSRPNHPLPFCR
jgi:hypothetical protein